MRILIKATYGRPVQDIRHALRAEGYLLDVVYGDQAAVRQSAAFPYDLVVIDAGHAGAQAWETCRRLRGSSERSPILMLSTSDLPADRLAGLNAGADDYLSEPVSFPELGARVAALIRRGHAAGSELLQVGDLTLDPVGRRAWRETAELMLNAKEFALLELFMRHPGALLTWSQVSAQVRGGTSRGGPRAVAQSVQLLRHKIDPDPDHSHLQAVRGAGYLLQPEPHR